MAGEKTEKATPKRKADERKKGNVFLSQEAVTVASLLSCFLALKVLSPSILRNMEGLLTDYIDLCAVTEAVGPGDLLPFFSDACRVFALTAMPLLLLCCAVAVAITMFQTRGLFSAKAFSFKGERINPLAGLKKMVSMRGLVELLKSILKISVLLYLLYITLEKEIPALARLMDMEPGQALISAGGLVLSIALKAGVIFLFLAAADYLYQWWEYEKNLRMTKQEVKEEYKQLEGDPQIKGAIRSRQQQKSRQRMMQNVPNADVVIRNPTHYAIAVKYDSSKNRAPIVLAKGVDALALRIVKTAEDAGVYVTENRPLARALYESVDLDQEIPEQFYQAIAEVLAFVYSLKGNGKA